MQKLVRVLDTGRLAEVDPKAMRRTGMALIDYVNKCSAEEEAVYQYKKRLVPFIMNVLDGKIDLPTLAEPYCMKLMIEGIEPMLPDSIDDYYYRFMLIISGCWTPYAYNHGEIREETIVDGARYMWVDFED